MSKIYLIDNVNDLIKINQRTIDCSKKIIFSCANVTQKEKHKIESCGFEFYVNNSKIDSRSFLNDYIETVGELSKEQKSLIWWATDLSSRNRFCSKLQLYLQQLIQIKDLVHEASFDVLVIFKPDVTIIKNIKKNLSAQQQSYVDLISGISVGFKKLKMYCRRVISGIYHSLRIMLRSFYAKVLLRKHLSQFKEGNSYYVMKSFVYDHSFNKERGYDDSFFGTLLQYLQKKNNVLIFATILGHYRLSLLKISKIKDLYIIPTEFCLKVSDILKGLFNYLFARIKIDKEIQFMGCDVTDVIKEDLKVNLNGVQIYQYFDYYATLELLRKIKVQQFLLTYENNPWEKMCMLAVRNSNQGTKILGFQHNVVPQASANMFLSTVEKDFIPKPDRILTTGEIPMNIISRYGAFDKKDIYSACALRHQYLFNFKVDSERSRTKNVLIACEGIFEVYRMVNYCLKYLANVPNINLIIRTHPVLGVSKFKHMIEQDIDKIQNLEISTGKSLEEDLKRSEIVIYWGSTVGMEALWMGRPVIHFDNGSILSYDPLFECEDLKWRVTTQDDLYGVVQAIQSMDNGVFQDQKKKGRTYLEKYFHPINDENLAHFSF